MMSARGNRLEGLVNQQTFDTLQCFPVSVEYDFVHRHGRLLIAHGGCTDMRGCIRYFESIDPDVERIETVNDQGDGTLYERHTGIWRAQCFTTKPRAGLLK